MYLVGFQISNFYLIFNILSAFLDFTFFSTQLILQPGCYFHCIFPLKLRVLRFWEGAISRKKFDSRTFHTLPCKESEQWCHGHRRSYPRQWNWVSTGISFLKMNLLIYITSLKNTLYRNNFTFKSWYKRVREDSNFVTARTFIQIGNLI